VHRGAKRLGVLASGNASAALRLGDNLHKLLAIAAAVFSSCTVSALAAPAPTPAAAATPCNPTPSVWASDNGSGVYGFTAPYTQVCALFGSPGHPFNQTQGLATDHVGNLYVADTGNKRIVVFSNTGLFLNAFSTNTPYGVYAPHGVCVSRKGVIGVAGTPATSGGAVAVEFFNDAGTLIGYAMYPQFNGALFCAFDKEDDFFADGAAQRPAGQNIWYVTRGNVHTMGATLMLSNVGNGAYWLGLYASNSVSGNTLSAASVPISGPGCNYCERVRTWAISGNGAQGPRTLSLQATCDMTYYPGIANGIRQIAPNAIGKLFAADFGDSQVVRSGTCGGGNGSVMSTTYAQWHQYFGVALYPTGQY
jgi:hypothetical protein